MTESQLSPINLYYHSNKQEWRARYVELESKKAKHFSCKRYGHNRAYFLSTLYLRVIQDRQDVLSNLDLSFWYSIVKDFKSLDEVPQKVMARPPTRTSHMSFSVGSLRKSYPELKDKCKFLDEKYQELFKKTVSDMDSKSYLSNPSFPIPDLCITSIKNEASNLCNLLRRYKFEAEKYGDKKEGSRIHGSSSTSSHMEEPTMSVYEIYKTLLELRSKKRKRGKKSSKQSVNKKVIKEDLVKEKDKEKESNFYEKKNKDKKDGKDKSKKDDKLSKKSKKDKEVKDDFENEDFEEDLDDRLDDKEEEEVVVENETFDDLLSLMRMNRRSYGEVSNLLNNFILKSSNTVDSYDFLNSYNTPSLSSVDLSKYTDKELFDEMVIRNQDLVDLGEDDLENFIKLCEKNEEIVNKMGEEFGEELYYRGNKETFVNTFSNLLEQESNPDSQDDKDPDDMIEDLEDTENNKSNTLYDQFVVPSTYLKASKEHAEDERLDRGSELNKVCNEKLNSLIGQTERVTDYEKLQNLVYNCLEQESKSSSDLKALIRISSRMNKDREGVYKSSRMYQMGGEYDDKYIDVVYENGKIIPKSTVQFFTKTNNKIVLTGNEKLDVNLDVLEKIFTKNYYQSDVIRTILDNLEVIDQKLLSIVQEYDTMHKALYEYINSPQKDPKSTNQLEEVVNLETLHFVTETLLETKLKFVYQIYSYFNSQLNLLETVIPKRYYKVFKKILYHKFNEF